ncbi:PLP-dependent aminotransferase family protein [Microbacterium jejuense]|uniref:MocR-like pyridoxine biosynthesis transcription factor PdxR n=1 Tax=Microbacterium jejuense TaxID=1263637 RepID=UPI0031EF2DCE
MSEGSIAGLDLHLPLSGTRPARSLEDAIRSLVSTGALPVGARLPAARALAADLGVARNTVADVYARLAAEGWLEARVGAGTWVAAFPAAASQAGTRPAAAPPFELRGGLVDASDFAFSAWSALARQTLAELPGTAFSYPPTAGVVALRQSLATYLARTRGVAVGPDNVVVGTGFGDLLSLVCRALRGRGARRIAVEEYGHERHRRIIAATGLEAVALPVDADGAVIEQLEGADAAAVVLTPAHQFPTGVPLSAARRRAVVDWARRTDALVLEDDYDGEFRYDRRSIGALQALAPDQVVYLGTASKALAPAVGLAWAVVPPAWRAEVLSQREAGGAAAAGIHQHVLARFIDAFAYDRAVRRRRAEFRTRRELLEGLLAERVPSASLHGLAAGLQCLVRLPADVREEAVVDAAARRGVAVQGLAEFRLGDGVAPAGIVVGYGAPSPARAERGLELFVEALEAAVEGR